MCYLLTCQVEPSFNPGVAARLLMRLEACLPSYCCLNSAAGPCSEMREFHFRRPHRLRLANHDNHSYLKLLEAI
jgi:hypothetical protein